MFNKIKVRCIDNDCSFNTQSTLCTRKEFHDSHVVKKSTNRIIEILTQFNLVTLPDCLGRETLIQIFIEFCIEPKGSSIINGDGRYTETNKN